MYAIGTVIYGYALDERALEELYRLEGEDPDWDEDHKGRQYGAVSTEYSGDAGYSPAWIGIEIMRINGFGLTKIDDRFCNFTPTPERVRQIKELVAKVPESLQALLGEEGVYIVWGTS